MIQQKSDMIELEQFILSSRSKTNWRRQPQGKCGKPSIYFLHLEVYLVQQNIALIEFWNKPVYYDS